MKFREWLVNIEETQNRNRSPQGLGDVTTAWGAASHFGGPRVISPISYGVDNRAFAGVLGGIGQARAKISARRGSEPGVAATFEPWPDERRDAIQSLTLPLQLPEGWDGRYLDYTAKSRLYQIKSIYGDAMDSTHIWRVDDGSNLIPPTAAKSHLYTFVYGQKEDWNALDSATSFTEALMRASLMVRLSRYSHFINLDSPRKEEKAIVKLPYDFTDGPVEGKKFFKLMTISFVFPSTKNAPDYVQDDIADRGRRDDDREKDEDDPHPRKKSGNTGPVSKKPRGKP